jgi:uncharacterized membrane protein
MASTDPLIRECSFVVLLFKMDIKYNSSTLYGILCRYGNTKDMLPIGGLVDIGETPIATGSRYYHQLINFFVKATLMAVFLQSILLVYGSYSCQN